jgi:hypothetical protein
VYMLVGCSKTTGIETYQDKSKDRGDQACQIESPLAANDIHGKSKAQCTYCQTGVGTCVDQAGIRARDAHLLIYGRGDQAYALRPGQIEEVAKTAKKPDAYLVPAEPEFVHLGVDESSLLLKRGEGMCCSTLEDSANGQVLLGGELDLVVDGDLDIGVGAFESSRLLVVGRRAVCVGGHGGSRTSRDSEGKGQVTARREKRGAGQEVSTTIIAGQADYMSGVTVFSLAMRERYLRCRIYATAVAIKWTVDYPVAQSPRRQAPP